MATGKTALCLHHLNRLQMVDQYPQCSVRAVQPSKDSHRPGNDGIAQKRSRRAGLSTVLVLLAVLYCKYLSDSVVKVTADVGRDAAVVGGTSGMLR